MDPQHSDAYYARGLTHFYMNFYKKAERDFSLSIEYDPHNSDAFFARALIECDQGDTNAALEDFTCAILLDPQYAEAYYRRGKLMLEMGNHAQSIMDLTEAVRLAGDTEAFKDRATAYFEGDSKDQAFADFSRYVTLRRMEDEP